MLDDDEVIGHMSMLVAEYACAQAENLSESAIELKHKVEDAVLRWSLAIRQTRNAKMFKEAPNFGGCPSGY